MIAEEEEPDAVTFSKNKEVAVAGLPRLVHADMFVTTVEGERDAASVSPQDVDALARLLPPHSASSRSTTRVVMYWVDVQKRHSAQALLEDPTLLSTLIVGILLSLSGYIIFNVHARDR